MVSILILTLNEEQNLAACLDSVAWSDDIVLFDSYSTDGTTEVARTRGARIVQRRFDNWSAHQNWAMENIEFRHRWVFYLDGDERMTPELRNEILDIAASPHEERVAFYCPRKNFFMGRWVRHAMPPCMIMRFFQPPKTRFERLVNPTPVLAGPHGYLSAYLLHYNFSKGLTEWLDRHNKYSLFEAVEGMKVLRGEIQVHTSLFSRDAAQRRHALKNLATRLPLRPFLKFFYMYVLKGGFLDGGPGLTYCTLQAIYEYMTVLKIRELHRKAQGLGM